MNGAVTEIRPGTAPAEPADQRQRTAPPGDVGTHGRHSAGHRPARSSLAGRGSFYPDPGHCPSQRGLIAMIATAWAIVMGCTVAMVVFL